MQCCLCGVIIKILWLIQTFDNSVDRKKFNILIMVDKEKEHDKGIQETKCFWPLLLGS